MSHKTGHLDNQWRNQ